jgi:hypothetical protein
MTMTRFSKPSWAYELGINMDELRAEHPFHPDQLRNHKEITKRGEDYWAHERFLPQAKYTPETILPEEPASVEIPVKRTRVRRYEFTDAQLEIARRSLNAGGAV